MIEIVVSLLEVLQEQENVPVSDEQRIKNMIEIIKNVVASSNMDTKYREDLLNFDYDKFIESRKKFEEITNPLGLF